jgi:hypothetical protein
MAKHLWLAKETLKRAALGARKREKAELQAIRLKRASLLRLLPPLEHWGCATETHVQVAATMLKQLPSMQRPASVQKLESWLSRRGCCKVKIGVPFHETVALMLPILHSFDVDHPLQVVLAPFVGISTNSDMNLASSAAARVVRHMFTKGDDMSSMGLSDIMGWLSSLSWASCCVTPAALVAELESQGIVQGTSLGGRLHYDDVALDLFAAVEPPAMKSNHVRDLKVKLGPGKVSGFRAKLLRMAGLQKQAAKWADVACKCVAGTFVFHIHPVIEFLDGLTLKLQVSIMGLQVALNTFMSALYDVAVDDITTNFSPPSCTCVEVPVKIAGRVIGKGGRNITAIENQHRVCLQVLQVRKTCIIKAWLIPYLWNIEGDPAKCVESLRATSQEKFRTVCVALNSLRDFPLQRRPVQRIATTIWPPLNSLRDQDVDQEQQMEARERRIREERRVQRKLKLAAIARRKEMLSRRTCHAAGVAHGRVVIRLGQKTKTSSLAQDIFVGFEWI